MDQNLLALRLLVDDDVTTAIQSISISKYYQTPTERISGGKRYGGRKVCEFIGDQLQNL